MDQKLNEKMLPYLNWSAASDRMGSIFSSGNKESYSRSSFAAETETDLRFLPIPANNQDYKKRGFLRAKKEIYEKLIFQQSGRF